MSKFLTKKGYKKLEKELQELKDVKRKKAVERLEKARLMGDLSENSEYHAAKEELGFIEGRIRLLESTIREAKIIEEKKDVSKVQIGDKVTLEKDGKKISVEIVGEFESNPLKGKISNNSPLGKALLGKKIKEEIKVTTPKGETTYTILEII